MRCAGWSPGEADGGDFAQEGQRAAAVVADEGFGFGKFGQGFDGFAEHETHAQAGLLGGGTQKAVVADADKALGQDVEEPALDELMGREAKDAGLAGVAAGPAQQDVAGLVVLVAITSRRAPALSRRSRS